MCVNTINSPAGTVTGTACPRGWRVPIKTWPSACSLVCLRVMCVYLIAGSAAWLQPLGVVPAAVDLSILVEINEVHQQLVAHAAHEARRVPTHTVTCPGCEHSDVSAVYLASTLNRKWNETTEWLLGLFVTIYQLSLTELFRFLFKKCLNLKVQNWVKRFFDTIM